MVGLLRFVSQLLACTFAKSLNLFKLQAIQEEMLSRELDIPVSRSDERLGLQITKCESSA